MVEADISEERPGNAVFWYTGATSVFKILENTISASFVPYKFKYVNNSSALNTWSFAFIYKHYIN